VSGYFGLKGRLGTPRASEHSSSSSSRGSGSGSSSTGSSGNSIASSVKQQQQSDGSSSSEVRDSKVGGKALSSGCNIRSQLVPILVPCPYPQFAEEDVAQDAAAAATPLGAPCSSSIEVRRFGAVNGAPPSSMELQVVTSIDESVPSSAAEAEAGLGTGSSTLERVDSQHLLQLPLSACNGDAATTTSSTSTSSSTQLCPRSSSSARRYTTASCGSNIVRSSGSSSSSSCVLDCGGLYSRCARLVCGRLPGLVLGGQIAAGTHGRVFRADYNCMKVSE
jgi:hypothetical protein